VPDEVHEVRGILAVMNGELRVEPELDGILAQQPSADAVERAGPCKGVSQNSGLVAENLGADPFDALAHLGGGASRERHQQNAPGVGAGNDELRHAMRQRIRLARPGAGDDQQRPANPAVRQTDAMHDRGALSVIQFFQMRRIHAAPLLCA
jgi:hypothetical protein